MPGRINTVGNQISCLEGYFLSLLPVQDDGSTGSFAGVELNAVRAVILEGMAIDALLVDRLSDKAVVVHILLLEIGKMPLTQEKLTIIGVSRLDQTVHHIFIDRVCSHFIDDFRILDPLAVFPCKHTDC